MIDLRRHHAPILSFLESGLAEFGRQHPDAPLGHAALYCCPWSGWVSLCLDRAVQLDQNCPDFEYTEFALYEASTWTAEYETEDPLTIVTASGEHLELDLDSVGDAALNAVFFDFLRQLLADPVATNALRAAAGGGVRVGVQLLDSQFNEAWRLAVD